MSSLSGMTVNERLFELNLIEKFDAAISSKNEQQAIAILMQAELSAEQAQHCIKTIFSNPQKYGYAQ